MHCFIRQLKLHQIGTFLKLDSITFLSFYRSGHVMILDISRIIIKSDLQPSNLTLEDATCMELEERLYDRLHAECSCQVKLINITLCCCSLFIVLGRRRLD